MIYLNVGFTGTKEGLTALQRGSLFRASRAIMNTVSTPICLHHGDCIGADSEMHDIARELGWRIQIHPPILHKYRAFREADLMIPEGSYLSRNETIVNASDVMFSCPKAMVEQTRSGTWHATRFARKKRKRIYLFWLDGTVTLENA